MLLLCFEPSWPDEDVFINDFRDAADVCLSLSVDVCE